MIRFTIINFLLKKMYLFVNVITTYYNFGRSLVSDRLNLVIALHKASKQETFLNLFNNIIPVKQLNNTFSPVLRRNDDKTRLVAFFLCIHQEPDQLIILHVDLNIIFVKNIKLGPENFPENSLRQDNLRHEFDQTNSKVFEEVKGTAKEIARLILQLNKLNILAYDFLIILVGFFIHEMRRVMPWEILGIEPRVDGSLKVWKRELH
jgi:hypothetical protein